MTSDMLWSILLLLVALVVVVIEFFLPTAGLLAVLATILFVASVILAFKVGLVWGTGMLVTTLVALPATIATMLRVLPYTPLGKRMFQPPVAPLPDPKHEELSSLIGRIGVTISEMMPSGLIEIDGKRLEAVAPGIVIPSGTNIEITRVSGNQIYVLPTDRQPEMDSAKPVQPALDQSLKELGLEELDRPLG